MASRAYNLEGANSMDSIRELVTQALASTAEGVFATPAAKEAVATIAEVAATAAAESAKTEVRTYLAPGVLVGVALGWVLARMR